MTRTFPAIACALLLLSATALSAQTSDNRGLVVREVSVSTGYGSVQLPPLTIGGTLPTDALNADVITTGEAQVDWTHATPRSNYVLQLLGTYTARTRYSQLNAPAASVGFGASRAVGRRWRLGAAVSDAIANSDPLTFQPTAASRAAGEAVSADASAAALARVRLPGADATQLSLFVPINQSIDGADLSGDRIMVSTVKGTAVYTRSVRFTTAVHGSYTTVRSMSSPHESTAAQPVADSTAESAGIGVTYGRAERHRLTASADWSRVAGIFANEVVSATLGYEWTGRQWFAAANVGASVRPVPVDGATDARLKPSRSITAESASVLPMEREASSLLMEREGVSLPMEREGFSRASIIGSAAVGHTSRSQTVFVQYIRASHDQYGNGGRNVVTGFEGDVQSIAGSWSWSAPRGRWIAQSDASLIRRPGNFSYIYAWLGTFAVGRQLGAGVRVMGELLFDRHGSRGFEGFHLTREGARLNVIWTPRTRPVAPDISDH